MSVPTQRIRLRIAGVVQGVGFRPFVASLATRLGLSGFVFNDGQGVTVEIEGGTENLDVFLSSLEKNPPELSRIDAIQSMNIPTSGEAGFLIHHSEDSGSSTALIPPDIAACDRCLEEVADPKDRRHRYAFTSCTQCGPRFTIVRKLPYDRENTTMAPFPLCESCAREYSDTADRRYHAETNACPRCGPQLALLSPDGTPIETDSPIESALEHLSAGKIVAIKGVGGFHIACDAANSRSISRLRKAKRRSAKPFAVMFPTIEAIQAICTVSTEERQLLTGIQRPIVLLNTDFEVNGLSPLIAPGLRTIGAFLPYTPLHKALLRAFGRPLVMTSGNLSDESIVFRDDQAPRSLGPLVDLILSHNREIVISCDDSVLRTWSEGTIFLRRSRGYVPSVVPVLTEAQSPPLVLGCGGAEKNTFCCLKDGQAILSQHLGDLSDETALDNYERSIDHSFRLFDFRPKVLAHDLHPDYPSTRYAERYRDMHPEVVLIPVQHHHAHFAGVLAEHGHTGQAIGICWDGTGLGDNGTIWGSEFLLGDIADYRRVGHLKPIGHPGGDRAAKEIWRMALAYVQDLSIIEAFFEALSVARIEAVRKTIDANINCPPGTSMGRLFDAVSSLCLGIQENTYEGQAATRLEEAARMGSQVDGGLHFEVTEDLICDPSTAIGEIVDMLRRGVPSENIAFAFHHGLAMMTKEVCCRVRERFGTYTVALSGGCFQNALLLDRVVKELTDAGFTVLTHQAVPPNDGGLSFGQAVVAAAQIFKRS